MAKRTGDIELTGGIISASGAAKGVAGDDINLTAGAGNATSGDGGSVNLIAGAAVGLASNHAGGDIILTPGAGVGTGSVGAIVITPVGVPTVTTDKLYNDGGNLVFNGTTISTGGNVSNTGTPVNNQLAIWTDATTIEGDAGLTFDGATLTLSDTLSVLQITSNQAEMLRLNDPIGADARLVFQSIGAVAARVRLNGVNFQLENINGPVQLSPAISSGSEYVEIVKGGLFLNERADHGATPIAAKGELWVRSDTPNVLVFTDDTGTDTVLGGAGTPTLISDADADTQIQVEESADEDIIRFDTGDAQTNFPAQPNALLLSSAEFTLALPAANVAAAAGSNISLSAGSGYTTGAGGAVTITAGDGGASDGAGGAITIQGGDAASSGGYGGGATISGGDAGYYGGNINLRTGYGPGGKSGGPGLIMLQQGDGYASSLNVMAITFDTAADVNFTAYDGRDVRLEGGDGVATNIDGGGVILNGGTGYGATGDGGTITIVAGPPGGASGVAGNLEIRGGASGSAAASGTAVFSAGLASGTAAGGPIILQASPSGPSADVVADRGNTQLRTGTGSGSPTVTIFNRFLDNATGATTNALTYALGTGDAAVFEVSAVARDGTDSAAFRIWGAADNIGGTAALIGSLVSDRTDSGGNAVDWGVNISVSTSNIVFDVDSGAETVDWKLVISVTPILAEAN